LSEKGENSMSATQILVVEDERIVATAIKSELQHFGYSVAGIASTAKEAVDKAVRCKPDLVLMDIQLQGEGDGIDAAREIRSRCGTPVVYLSAFSDIELLGRAGQTGAFGYLIKPYEERELHTTIELALAKHRAVTKNEESGRWLGAIFDGMDAAVIATDPDYRVRFMNLEAEAMTGWRREDAAGAPFSAVCKLVQESSHGELEYLTGRAVCESRQVELPADTSLLTKDDRSVAVRGCLSPIHDAHGEFLGLVFSLRCATIKQPERSREQQTREAPVQVVPQRPPTPQGARPSILLVDSDPAIREGGSRALERSGFRVLTAESGKEAVALYQQEAGGIDMVVMDLNLPDLTGQAVLQCLVEIDPTVRVLFASSYFARDLMQGDGHTLGVISKPYGPDDLIHVVQQAMARHVELRGA
jgi:PAS domain S-box-containing protein